MDNNEKAKIDAERIALKWFEKASNIKDGRGEKIDSKDFWWICGAARNEFVASDRTIQDRSCGDEIILATISDLIFGTH